MDDRLNAEIERHFTPQRTSALVRAVRGTYDRAVQHYSPEDGWDAQMFGFAVYKYSTKRLLCLTRDAELAMELRSSQNAFRLGVGPFTLATYCCGHSGDQDISESFPTNEHGAPALVDLNQLCLELEFDETAVPRALVLAHLGNSTNGLEALYLAAPSSKQDNRISGWSYTRLLWKWEGGEAFGGTSPHLPPPAPIDPAPLSLKLPVEKRAGKSSDK